MVFKTPDDNLPYRVPFAMLLGMFEVSGSTASAKRSRYTAAPINTQGYERFTGEIVYSFRIRLTPEQASQAAYCTLDTREAAELFINGVSAGVRLWAPNQYPAAGLFRAGDNEITVRATIPMWNLFCAPGKQIDVGVTGVPRVMKQK